MPDPPRISDAEWEVMSVVWDRHPVTASDVHLALGSRKPWTDRTVKTLLSRLLKKGCLTHEVEGKRYLYAPAVSREECVRAESRSFVDRVFGGDTSPLLAHFVEEGELSDAQIADLRRLLDERLRADDRARESGGRS